MDTHSILTSSVQEKCRRHFSLVLSAVCLLVLFSHLPAFGGEKTIGFIITGDIRYYRDIHNAFMAKLSREGYEDKVRVIVQTPFPDPISLSNAVRKLIAVDVDVIVTCGALATVAAFNEKTKIPIVYADVYEPIASRLKARNITGVSSKPSLSSLLRYLRGTAPLKTIGIIYNSSEEDSAYQARELGKLSDQYGLKAESINIKGHRNVKAVLSGRKVDAILVTHSCMAGMVCSEIEDFSRTHRIPTASLTPGRSFIITLCAAHKDLGEKAAERAIKVLNGIPPEKISRAHSSDTELIFNLKEAVSMGFDIPVELVTEATKLIK